MAVIGGATLWFASSDNELPEAQPASAMQPEIDTQGNEDSEQIAQYEIGQVPDVDMLDEVVAGSRKNISEAELEDLANMLAAMSSEQAEAMVAGFLAQGAEVDINFPVPFKLERDGSLARPTSLRVFLLQKMAELHPESAVPLALQVLDEPTATDEWAISLQVLGRASADDAGLAELFADKTQTLLTYEPWLEKPDVAYLEAFDTAVYLGGASLAEPLATHLANPERPVVAHAAFLALDRKVINDTAAMLAWLQDGGDEQIAIRPEARASYYARADIRDASQRESLESYLLDPARTEAELEAFTGLFPNMNFMLAPALLTQPDSPSRSTIEALDRATLEQVEAWLDDPGFASIKPYLEASRARLQQFVHTNSATP